MTIYKRPFHASSAAAAAPAAARGIPNQSGVQCFMNSLFQMLFVIRPMKEIANRLVQYPRREEVFAKLAPTEKCLLRVFWYLQGLRREFLNYDQETMLLYNVGFGSSSSSSASLMQMQDAAEFLGHLGDFFLEKNKQLSILRQTFPTTDDGKTLLHFHWSVLSAVPHRALTLQDALDEARILALEPKYPQDAPYPDQLDVRRQKYFFLEIDRGGEMVPVTTEVAMGPGEWLELKVAAGRRCRLMSVILCTNQHYRCCVRRAEEGWKVLDDSRVYALTRDLASWVKTHGRLYLFEFE